MSKNIGIDSEVCDKCDQFDSEIIKFAFRTLTSTNDLGDAIKTLLEKIGIILDLCGIYIFEKSLDGSFLESTYEWQKGKKCIENNGEYKIQYIKWVEYIKKNIENGIITSADYNKEYNDDCISYFFENFTKVSMLSCAIIDGCAFKGCISIYDNNMNRVWSEKEKQTLSMVSKIIDYYFFKMQNARCCDDMVDLLMNYDKVTSLMKIDKFKNAITEYVKKDISNKKYAIIYSDIGNFKYINDNYGYSEGDKVLNDYAKTFCKLNKNCVFACREFSDYFISFMQIENKDEMVKLLFKNNVEFSEKLNLRYSKGNIKVISGAYILEGSRNFDVNKAIDKANIARKSAKNSMHTYAIYNGKLNDKFIKESKIESSMNEALLKGEFQVYIQPKYDLNTLEIVSCEALVRWIKEGGQIIYPDEFIPLFEKNGFIEKLDYYMLETVCKKLKALLDKNVMPCPVSINQSRYLLYNPVYFDNVKSIILKYEIPTNLIELELTENLFFEDGKKMIDIMNKMKEFGISISIDDFGSGYSSLNLLKQLPVDILKIDREFLSEAETSNHSKIIIKKVVELSKELNIKVVCEGVETLEQEKFLKSIACDMAQGYLYAKPMPIETFNKIMNFDL